MNSNSFTKLLIKDPQMAKDLESVFMIEKHQEESGFLKMFDINILYKMLKIKSEELEKIGYRCVVEKVLNFETGDPDVLFLALKDDKTLISLRIKAGMI